MAKDKTDIIAELLVKLADCLKKLAAGRALIVAILHQRVTGMGRAFDMILRLNGQKELRQRLARGVIRRIDRHDLQDARQMLKVALKYY